MSMSITLALDLLVAGLLVATIVYCWMLNRRLDSLRGAQEQLKTLIQDFNRATEQARSGVQELKQASQLAGEELRQQVDKARGLADELVFITDTGVRLAERLEKDLESGRRQGSRPDTVGAGGEAVEGGSRSEAERELLQALRRVK